MKVFMKELERDKKNCFEVTAWMEFEKITSSTGEVRSSESLDATTEIKLVTDAIFLMIGIEYATEKQLKGTGFMERPLDYFLEHFSKLFEVEFPVPSNYWEMRNDCRDDVIERCRYDSCKIVKYEYGQEAYEVTIDNDDAFVAMVRSICDRILEEYHNLSEMVVPNYWNEDFLEGLKPLVRELRSEILEYVKIQ